MHDDKDDTADYLLKNSTLSELHIASYEDGGTTEFDEIRHKKYPQASHFNRPDLIRTTCNARSTTTKYRENRLQQLKL